MLISKLVAKVGDTNTATINGYIKQCLYTQ